MGQDELEADAASSSSEVRLVSPVIGAVQLRAWAVATAVSRLPTPRGPAKSKLGGSRSWDTDRASNPTSRRCPMTSLKGMTTASTESYHASEAVPETTLRLCFSSLPARRVVTGSAALQRFSQRCSGATAAAAGALGDVFSHLLRSAAVVPTACRRSRTPCFDVAQHALSGVERAGSRARLAHPSARASTRCWLPRRSRAWHAPAQLIPTARITRSTVDAEPSPRAPSGLHEVGVLRRRRAAGTTAAGRAGVRRASAGATRSGAAGQGCGNRGAQVLIAAISGPVIRAGETTPSGVDARRMSRGEPPDRRGCESVRTEGPRFRRVRPGGDGRCRPRATLPS